MSLLIYLAIAVFIIGNLYRVIRIVRMPVHLRWELYPVPHEPPHKARYGGSYMEESDWWKKKQKTNPFGELDVMLPEILLLAGVWEHNRMLWFWSWLMHWGCYLLVGVIALTFTGAVGELAGLTIADPANTIIGLNLFSLIIIIGWLSGLGGFIGAAGVLILRLFSRKLRPFLSFGGVFDLALMLAFFSTGVMVYSQGQETFHTLFGFTKSLISFSEGPEISGVLAVHVTLFTTFLFYFPFTHMTHMFEKYFMWHSVRWDDQPIEPGSSREKKLVEALHYPVGWAAPHVGADGKKNWVDVATGEGKKNA